MQLPPEQVSRFYRVWFELLHFVNEQRHLAPDFPDDPIAGSVSTSDALELRNALWADDALRESFIATNPADLSPDDLALVASWQYRVDGKFFIVRHLKKYSVFLSEQPAAHAYGVLGLVSPIEEVVIYPVPVYTHAVLLPFEGQIAVPTNLREVRKGVLTRNAKILGAFRKELARRGLSHNMVEKHASNIDTFAREYLLEQDPPRGLLDMTAADVENYLRASENETLTTSFKRYVRFLDETARMDYDQIVSLQALLKQGVGLDD